ncbi:hypothetical protein CIB48_g2596 [Xylaria polymorpha]|nr:hypothetical protein CIB48_g2596 [Xylaria polymorpha]
MVVLRNMSHYEHRIKKVEQRSAERQKTGVRPIEKRKSPRRTRGEEVKEEKRDQAQTPLGEKKSEENTRAVDRDLVIRSRINADQREDAESIPLYHNDDTNRSYEHKRRKSKSGKAKATKGIDRRIEANRNWGKRSPPIKRRRLEDEVPMIIECWQ